ncbi:MAG: hypothetical protein LBI14_08165 [Treponema sp.]|nr:hypothetical protein [Treponema sp.]
MSNKKSLDENRISWHPAFFEAIQMELDEYSNALEFTSEYRLNTEPLRIDVVIIKKSTDIPIKKNIAAVFRKVNIVEYKSPGDHISVEDFYKVYGYACIYTTINEIDMTELTLTFVGSRHPRKLLSYLKKKRGYLVEKKQPGIYTVSGDILPIQIIDSNQLFTKENMWLKDLNNRLGVSDMDQVTDEIRKQKKAARIRAYLDVITKANPESFKEVLKMRKTAKTRDEILEEAGLITEWIDKGKAIGEASGEARGEEKKATEIARNMLKDGFTMEKTAELSGLDISRIRILITS